MPRFRLIQRGKFLEKGKYLIGDDNDGIIRLDYMSSAEFEFSEIPKAYCRLMYNFTEYEVVHTRIYTPENEELILFCNKNSKEEITQMINEFITNPYHLKEYSELEKVPKVKKSEKFGRHTNFWWCIDLNTHGDWMAFLGPQLEMFLKAIRNEYEDWWMKKSKRNQKKEYKKALCY